MFKLRPRDQRIPKFKFQFPKDGIHNVYSSQQKKKTRLKQVG